MRRYTSITEKRRNPKLNPHIGAWDRLIELKDDPDVYISFTTVDKIGINPQSKYNTPVGIYSYPLKEFVKTYIEAKYPNLEGISSNFKYMLGSFAPYAGGSKYVNFIRLKDKSNFIEDMYTDYGSNDYDRDIAILKKNYSFKFRNIEKIKIALVESFKQREFFGADIWQVFDEINVQLLNFKNEELEDKIISGKSKKTLLKIVVNDIHDKDWTAVKEDLDTFLTACEDLISPIIEEGIETAKDKNPVTSMWNITRLLAQKLSKSNKQTSTKWNLILSKDLGYSGFADKSGRGIIHNAEPMQAVFLRNNAFTLLYRERNVPKKKEFDLETEEGQIDFIFAFPERISSIKNPSEKVQIAVVKHHPSQIEEFDNPSEKVQLEAIRSGNVYGRNILQYIKNPTEKAQLESLKIADIVRAMYSIKKPTEKVQMEFIKKGGSIKYIKNPTEKVQLFSIEKSPKNIAFINKPTEKVELEAVKQLGIEAVTYVSSKKAIDLMTKMVKKKESYKRYKSIIA